MSEQGINLDRAANEPIEYPLGVTETIVFEYVELVSLDDEYEVLIFKSKKEKNPIITITEATVDPELGNLLSRNGNELTWIVNFEKEVISPNVYYYKIRNKDQDYSDFRGLFTVKFQ